MVACAWTRYSLLSILLLLWCFPNVSPPCWLLLPQQSLVCFCKTAGVLQCGWYISVTSRGPSQVPCPTFSYYPTVCQGQAWYCPLPPSFRDLFLPQNWSTCSKILPLLKNNPCLFLFFHTITLITSYIYDDSLDYGGCTLAGYQIPNHLLSHIPSSIVWGKKLKSCGSR